MQQHNLHKLTCYVDTHRSGEVVRIKHKSIFNQKLNKSFKMALKNFPRGGKKADIKVSNNFFQKATKIKAKKVKLRPKSTGEILLQNKHLTLNSAQNLRYSVLCEGMTILGRMFKVTDYYAIVSLPGQISGKLHATNISESYTDYLKNIANNGELSSEFKSMSDIYKKGDYVICYIKELHPDSKKITLSLEPQLINQNLNPSNFVKGSKVAMSICSIEDHGFVLETGLKNFRAFLSLQDIGDGKIEFHPGRQIVCAIKDIKVSENTFTAKVSIKSKHLDSPEINISSIDDLIPRTQIRLTIKKILNNGLQVYFGENNIGYINQLYTQNPLSSFNKGQEVIGTLMYIVPTLKFAYFSLLSQEKEKKSLPIGELIEGARVLSHDAAGILVRLENGIRGYIPFKRTEVDYEKLSFIFPIDSIHKCKVIAYDQIARLYICTMEKKILSEEYVNASNLQPGNIVEATITDINENNQCIKVLVGKTSGIVPCDQLSDPGSTHNLKIGQNVRARVLDTSGKKILTLKKTLIDSKLPILCKLEDGNVNEVYHGTVTKIIDQGILVRFFGNVRGWIPKRYLSSQSASEKRNYALGETITVIIKAISITNKKITLAPYNDKKKQYMKYKIGDIVEGLVIDSSAEGIHLKLNNNIEDGPIAFLPAGHMSPCNEVGKLLAAKTVAGDKLSATIFSTNPNLILSTTFASKQNYKMNDLDPGDILLCSVKKMHRESLKVLLPIAKCSKYGTVFTSNAGNVESIYENQLLFGKILKIEKTMQEVNLTTQLSKVWDDNIEHEVKMMTAVDLLSSYLNKISDLSHNIYYTSRRISKVCLGQRIEGTVENIMDHGLILDLEEGVKGIVRNDNFFGCFKIGDKVLGTVLWVDYPHEYIEITMIHNVMNSISTKQSKLSNIPIGIQLRGEIVLVTDWFVLLVLKGQGKGTLVALPVRRHLNDIEPDISPYKIGEKVRCYGVLNKTEAEIPLPICMLKSAFELRNIVGKVHNSVMQSKRTAETVDYKKNVERNFKQNELNEILENVKEVKKRKAKSEEEPIRGPKKLKKCAAVAEKSDSESKHKEKKGKEEETEVKKHTVLEFAIPECGFKWDSSTETQELEENSSSSENEAEDFIKQKQKKKLTPAERRELERHKEREIREREEILANTRLPETVDQFDRLLLSSPDSSLVWMQYMAYHLQATEIEKARTVAKRALQTINFREENERLNVWQAWLNLESRFGSLESLNKVFQEAVKTNDAWKIYAHMLTIHVDAGRQSELEKTVSAMIAKFKQDPETWISCGSALLKIGMKDKSRHIMHRALQSLSANKHINLMVRFAQLENKFGDKERSQTLFERVLSSYPKRTDLWSSFVDSLVKTGDIEIARKVLDRAIKQSLPVKKMKVLFKKFINFEDKHGTPENIARVRELAVEYIEEQFNKVDQA